MAVDRSIASQSTQIFVVVDWLKTTDQYAQVSDWTAFWRHWLPRLWSPRRLFLLFANDGTDVT